MTPAIARVNKVEWRIFAAIAVVYLITEGLLQVLMVACRGTIRYFSHNRGKIMQIRMLDQTRHHMRRAGTIVTLIFAFQLSSCGNDAGSATVAQNTNQAQLAATDDVPATNADGIEASPVAPQTPAKAAPSSAVYWPLWQCNAYPVNGLPFIYWIHANANFAARSAMNACWNMYFVPCNYSCFRIR
ncbi:MAG: hypothetical protein RIQ81_1907 [Pseudomonadota bacterium]